MSSQPSIMVETEKPTSIHIEANSRSEDTSLTGFETDEASLPPGYYKSAFFLGTLSAISVGFFAGVGGFGFAAPILLSINADIGPDPNIAWVSLSYTLTTGVCITIIGRLSDIFGRRWIFIGGTSLGLIGSIIGATAKNVSTLIGATAIIGIGASSQLSYYYVLGELVPMKYRFLANSVVYIMEIPSIALAPVLSNSFLIYHPSVGWQGNYYLLIALNTLSLMCWVFFYHPPTFHMKHESETVWKYIKNFDYIGTVLYTAGLLLLLMGLNWGGATWPWDSAHVIATIVTGFLALVAFVLWECCMNLKEPLVPMKLFLHKSWVASTILSGLGQSIYYAFAIVWPQMVTVLFASSTSPIGAAWLSCMSGIGWAAGITIGGLLAQTIRRIKLQCFVSILVGGLFFGLVATCTPDTKARACGLVAMGSFFIGWTENLAVTAITLTTQNQGELGTAGGIAGSIRYLITSISTTVYTVVLSNRQAEEIPQKVAAAVTTNGLPASSVSSFISALAIGPSAFADIPGITPRIIAAGSYAYRVANSNSFRTVFLSTIAFSCVALIATLFLPNFDSLLSDKIATTLGKEKVNDATNKV